MSRKFLHTFIQINYHEAEKPNLDEYVFCGGCMEFVYEYCSIHGPLLVLPDEVPSETNLPSLVPRSALTIPSVFLHLAPSSIPVAGIGVFASLALPAGVRFGPYRGKISKNVESEYCWQIYDKDNRPSHVVDAADAERSNWMRYVNCSRHWCEQNLLAYQYKGQVYYRTIKMIPKYTELLVFYGSEYANILNVDLRLYNTPPLVHYENLSQVPKEIESNNNRHQSSSAQIPFNTHTHHTFNNNINKLEIDKESKRKAKAIDRHAKKHTNDKPFSCPFCQYKCARKSRLKEHSRTHTGEKPFACTNCEYRCAKKYSLDRHLRTHIQRNRSFTPSTNIWSLLRCKTIKKLD